MPALYRAKLSYHKARDVQSKIDKKPLCRSDFFHVVLNENGSISKQSGRARPRRGLAPLHPGQGGGGGGPPISVSEIPTPKNQKVNDWLLGAVAPVPDILLGKADRGAPRSRLLRRRVKPLPLGTLQPIRSPDGPTVQRIEHEAVAAVSVHLLRAPRPDRATVDRRPYGEPADGPGAFRGRRWQAETGLR
jgi:hypothetical protein